MLHDPCAGEKGKIHGKKYVEAISINTTFYSFTSPTLEFIYIHFLITYAFVLARKVVNMVMAVGNRGGIKDRVVLQDTSSPLLPCRNNSTSILQLA